MRRRLLFAHFTTQAAKCRDREHQVHKHTGTECYKQKDAQTAEFPICHDWLKFAENKQAHKGEDGMEEGDLTVHSVKLLWHRTRNLGPPQAIPRSGTSKGCWSGRCYPVI